jgi:peptide/nickel transport system substrate-binding protein
LLEPFQASLPPEAFSARPEVAAPSDGSARQAFRQLVEAGWQFDKKQMKFVDKRGRPVMLRAIYSDRSMERIFLSFRPALARIGIGLDLQLVDSARFQDELNKREYDLMPNFHYGRPIPSYSALRDSFASVGVGAADMDNVSGASSPAIDALIERLRNPASEEERAAAPTPLDRALLAGAYEIPFGTRAAQKIVCRKSVGHPEPASPYSGVYMPSMGWSAGPGSSTDTAK